SLDWSRLAERRSLGVSNRRRRSSPTSSRATRSDEKPRMSDIRGLVARMDVDQKIGQIQGVVPMDLVDFARFSDRSVEAPDLTKGFPYDIHRLSAVTPHGTAHLA